MYSNETFVTKRWLYFVSTEGVEGPPGPAKPTDPAVTEPIAGQEEPKGPEGGDTGTTPAPGEVEGKSQCKLIFFKS